MQKVIKDIADELVQVAAAISAHIPNDEPFSVASGNWSFPGVTRSEILTKVKDTTLLVQAFPDEDISLEAAKYLADFPRRLTFLRAQTIPNTPGNAAGGVPAIYLTLQALNDALSGLQPPAPAEELAASVKRVTQQVRAMETRFKELTPRALDLETMVGRIELAHEAADRLPEDLASLNERQERADELLRFVDDDRVKVAAILARAVLADVKLTESTTEAAAVLEQCGAAYSANTSCYVRRSPRADCL